MNWDELRPGQLAAIETIMRRYRAEEAYTSIVLPTRYGKSDVMRMSALALWTDGFLPCALALSPNLVLASQLGSVKKWNESLKRYQVSISDIPIATLTTPLPDPDANGEFFLSATIQLVQRNIDVYRQWVESVWYRTGRRPLVFVDECHTGSDVNQWGEAARLLEQAGARVVLLTATAIRSDGHRIPGFDFEVIQEEPVRQWITRPGSEPELVRVEIYEGVRRLLRLRADHETPFADAWEEGALCHVSRVPLDVELSRFDDAGSTAGLMLSQLTSTTAARKAISKAVRSRPVMQLMVARMVQQLQHLRHLAPDVAAIVFCGNDTDTEKTMNQHANEIKQEIGRIAPELQVQIATSAEGDGKTRLEAFAGGFADVLLVKQMASVGLDIPRLKVGVDLSPARTAAGTIQRMMRIATPYKGISVCVWIGLDDLIFRALFEALVGEGGGEASVADLELLRFYEKPPGDKRPADYFGVDSALLGDFDDTAQHHGAAEQMVIVEQLLQRWPWMLGHASHAELAEGALGLRLSTEEASTSTVQDTGITREALRADINQLVDDLVERRVRMVGYDREEWVELRRDIFARAKRAAGESPARQLSEISQIDSLRAMKRELERYLAEVWEA